MTTLAPLQPRKSAKPVACDTTPQKAETANRGEPTGDRSASNVREVMNSPGQPLDPASRDSLEPCFGHDFSAVRIHADESSARSAHALHADAYTVGSNIVFGTNRYKPHTPAGERLLAHELAHTIQQRQGGTSPTSDHEAEANQAADRVLAGGAAHVHSGVALGSIQRAAYTDVPFGEDANAELREYWVGKEKRARNPEIKARYREYIRVIDEGDRPSWQQSEQDMKYFYRQIGPADSKIYKDGRKGKRVQIDGRWRPEPGSTVPDIVPGSVMLEVKNYSIENNSNLIKTLKRQLKARAEQGDANIRQQGIILDFRGQEVSEEKIQRLVDRIVAETGIPGENIQVVRLAKPAVPRVAPAKSATTGAAEKQTATPNNPEAETPLKKNPPSVKPKAAEPPESASPVNPAKTPATPSAAPNEAATEITQASKPPAPAVAETPGVLKPNQSGSEGIASTEGKPPPIVSRPTVSEEPSAPVGRRQKSATGLSPSVENEASEGFTQRRRPVSGVRPAVEHMPSTKQMAASMILHLGSGIALGIFQSEFKEKMRRDLAAMPPPQIDQRSLGDYLKDPAAKDSMRLIDIFSKNFKPFGQELRETQGEILAGFIPRILVLKLLPPQSPTTVDNKIQALHDIMDELGPYEEILVSIRDNLSAILALEEKAHESQKAADDLNALLRNGAVFEWLFNQGFKVDELSQMSSNLSHYSALRLPTPMRWRGP
jgi:hypothetical protein